MPTTATSRGTSRPAARSALQRAEREQVVGAEDRVGPCARSSSRSAASRPGVDREVVGDLDERVVALEAAGAQPVEVAEPARRARRRALRAR